MSSLWSQCFSLKSGYLYNNKYVSIITSLHLSEIRLFVNVTLLTMSHGGYIVMVVYKRNKKYFSFFSYSFCLWEGLVLFLQKKEVAILFFAFSFLLTKARHSSNIRWNMYKYTEQRNNMRSHCYLPTFFLTPRKKFALETETYIGQPGRIWNEYDYFYDIVSVVC